MTPWRSYNESLHEIQPLIVARRVNFAETFVLFCHAFSSPKKNYMETTTISCRSIDLLIILYDLHTRLFSNVIEGISDKDAQNRLNTKANHVAWLAGSLVHDRYEMANAAGVEIQQVTNELFKGPRGIRDHIAYPSLTVFKNDWDLITPILRKALLQLNDAELNSADPYGMPGDDLTFLDAITFLIDRESYCIGQIGLYRRLLGYEPMKYQ
jgi:hypothetical protein